MIAPGALKSQCFADVFTEYQSLIQKDAVLVIEGEVINDDYSGGLKVRTKTIMSLMGARNHYARKMVLTLTSAVVDKAFSQRLATLFTQYQGNLPVQVDYRGDDAAASVILGEPWQIKPDDELVLKLHRWLGKASAKIEYA